MDGCRLPAAALAAWMPVLAAALLAAAQKHGAVAHGTDASPLAEQGAVRGVQAGGAVIEADMVAMTGGAWADGMLAPLGPRLGLQPQRGQVVHLHRPGAVTRDWPVLPMDGCYLLAFDDAHVVVGATRETGSGFDHRVTAGGLTLGPFAGRQVAAAALGMAQAASDSASVGRPRIMSDAFSAIISTVA